MAGWRRPKGDPVEAGCSTPVKVARPAGPVHTPPSAPREQMRKGSRHQSIQQGVQTAKLGKLRIIKCLGNIHTMK